MSRDALVVGISSYQWLPGLQAPAHDAEAIAQQLQINGEFRVTRMPDTIQNGQSRVGMKTPVTVAELETALVKLFKPRGNNVPHTALFYFSGHGLQKNAGIQEGYLATSDANPDAGFYGLSLFWLRRLLQESPVRQRIILLDCCHSGELLNFLEADPGAKSGTDRLFMAASREYEAAYEAIAGEYSVFTQALLGGLDPARVASGTVTNYALTDWVSNALKGETQQPLFENSGSEITLTRCQGLSTILKAELTQEVCPYRGLECFDEAHAEYFFGREDLTDQLLEKLRTQNFVAVVGASGSGKSSLVRAGLIHQLRQGHKFSGSDRWRIQLITPTEQPLRSLASAFVNSKAPTVDRAEHLRRAETLLREGGNGLAHLVRASLISSKYGRNSRLLLIIDQFEEVFTLCQGPQAERDRHRFFNSMLTAMQEASDCLSIVIVLRADFFGKCSLYNGLAEKIEQNLVTATPLTYDQIKASVVKPAQKVGVVCNSNLVYNILLDVVGAPGELPLLQYTLLELWQQRQLDPDGGPDRLTLDAYTELGGVRGTLQKRADAIFYSLSPEEQRVAKRIFIALTQLGDGTEDTRRRILKSELVSPRFPVELVDRVLEKLVNAKLIVTNQIIPPYRHQERIDQGIANVSTALRLAQMCQGKFSSQLSTTMDMERSTGSLGENLIQKMTQLPTHQLAERAHPPGAYSGCQETVDVAHETLIRHWSLLQTWLDESREMLRQQRRIEHSAREWQNIGEPRSNEYLLHGNRLGEAEEYLKTYPDELSALAQRFVAISREENRRTQRELRLLQMVIPCTLLAALMVTLTQYRAAIKSQAEKDYQLQVATSRQQAAIAQSILQEPDGDPMTALLISRLAAEKGGRTYEAQASLRTALQKLPLQADLRGHQGAIHQVAFSPDQRYLATAGEDGTIRLWSMKTQAVERVLRWEGMGEGKDTGTRGHGGTGTTNPASANAEASSGIMAIAFSPDGKQIAAIAHNATQVQVWSVASGVLQFQLESSGAAMTQLAFSPNGAWIATTDGSSTVQIWRARDGHLQKRLIHAAEVRSIGFSPDGRSLLTASGKLTQRWKLATGKVEQRWHHASAVKQAVFSPDGRTIATLTEAGSFRLWQTVPEHGTGEEIEGEFNRSVLALSGVDGRSLSQVVFSPDGQWLAATDQRYQFWVWEVRSGRLWLQGTKPVEGAITKSQAVLAFSPDSRQLLTTGLETSNRQLTYVTYRWDVRSRQRVETLRGHAGAIEAAQFNQDGSLIATASADGSARLWTTDPGSEFPPLKMMGDRIQWAVFRPSSPGQPGADPGSATTHSAPTAATTAAPLQNDLVTVAVDGSMRRWNLPPNPRLEQPPELVAANPADASSSSLALKTESFNPLKWMGESLSFLKTRGQNPSGNWMLSAVRAPQLAVNEAATASSAKTLGKSIAKPEIATDLSSKLATNTSLTGVAFNLNGTVVATADRQGSLKIWQIQPSGTVTLLQTLLPAGTSGAAKSAAAHPNQLMVRQLAFSPDQQLLLGVGDDRIIYLWNVSSGKLVASLKGHTATIEQARFSPDGQFVVSASRDRTARIWQISTGELISTLTHRYGVSSAQLSADNQRVLTTSLDGTARVLDVQTGTIKVLLAGHHGAVLDAEFSPDGQTIVTASVDGTARLWDAQTGTEQAILRPATDHEEPIQRVFFSPDGHYVATLVKSGKLFVWAANWDGLLELARDRSLRQLQPEECLRYLRLPPNACPSLDL